MKAMARSHIFLLKTIGNFESRMQNQLRLFFTTGGPSTSSSTDNLVERFIKDKIRATGPMTVCDFMKLSTGSQVGYYSKADTAIFGRQGDFITAPELGQIFGELLAIWVLNALKMTGHSGQPWTLVELGPGTGALMNDLLRCFKKLEVAGLNVHLVEISERLATRQRKSLCDDDSESHKTAGKKEPPNPISRYGFPIFWNETLDECLKTVGNEFTVFIANEFFDALPVHQFQRSPENEGEWREVYINLDGKNRLCFMLSRNENIHTKTLIPEKIRKDKSITEWECRPEASKIARQMADRITMCGGFGLVFDYGHDGSRRTHSLRAYQKHTLINPLEHVGQVDITADVDFGQINDALQNSKSLTFGPVEQRRFLAEMGFIRRLDYLLKKCQTDQRKTLIENARILVGDDSANGMGTRFKAFSLFPAQMKPIFKKCGGLPIGFWTLANQKRI